MAKKIFYCIVLALIVLTVVALGAVIKVNNPLMLLIHVVGCGGVFVGGYALGRKTK